MKHCWLRFKRHNWSPWVLVASNLTRHAAYIAKCEHCGVLKCELR